MIRRQLLPVAARLAHLFPGVLADLGSYTFDEIQAMVAALSQQEG